MKTFKRPFDIIIKGSPGEEPRVVQTIEVEVYENCGEEFLTQESRRTIARLRSHHLGLMTGEDIRELRVGLNYTQARFADLLQCGKKSVSRWENGEEGPSRIVNAILRLLASKLLTPADLESVQGPLLGQNWLQAAADAFSGRRKKRKRRLLSQKPQESPEVVAAQACGGLFCSRLSFA